MKAGYRVAYLPEPSVHFVFFEYGSVEFSCDVTTNRGFGWTSFGPQAWGLHVESGLEIYLSLTGVDMIAWMCFHCGCCFVISLNSYSLGFVWCSQPPSACADLTTNGPAC